ncbi:MAG: DNA polymerase III subunit [Planctomycetaceae bacterium]
MLTDWRQLRGHAEQRELFRRSLQRGRLSHAYVLAGPEGIGKRQFARLLAKSVFCRNHDIEELDVCGDCRACRAFEHNAWPDYHELSLLSGKNEIVMSQMVGDDDKRGREGLCFELAMAPQASDRRVAVINDASRMNAATSNALLKTLEEPPAQALILLICDDPDALLPTIRSRCQLVRFFPLPQPDVTDILLAEGSVESDDEATAVASLSEGSLETARQLLSPELRQLRTAVAEQLALLDRMKPLETAAQVTSGIEQISSGVPEQRQNAQWLLKFVADAIRTRLKNLAAGEMSDPLTERLGIRPGVDLLAPMLERTVTASQQITGMSPIRLVMDSLFDDLAQMCRRSVKRK